MAGGLFPGKPFEFNVKCIVFSLVLSILVRATQKPVDSRIPALVSLSRYGVVRLELQLRKQATADGCSFRAVHLAAV